MKFVKYSIWAFGVLISTAHADISNTEWFKNLLTREYGANVDVQISNDKCSVTFPEVIITEQIFDNQNHETEASDEPKVITTNIEPTVTECKKITNYNTYPQYSIKLTSLNKLIGQIYNTVGISDVKNISAGNYTETYNFIPELKLVNQRTWNIDNALFSKTDATTGLKKEIGNLKHAQASTTINFNQNRATYAMDSSLNSLNIALPFFSFSLPSMRQSGKIEYIFPQDSEIDYENIKDDIVNINGSKARSLAKGITMKSEMLGGLVFDIDAASVMQRSNNIFDIKSSTEVKNIYFIGDFVSPSKQPKNITIHTFINDLSISKLEKIVEFYKQNKNIEQSQLSEQDENRLAQIAYDIAKKVRFAVKLNVNFTNAAIDANFKVRVVNSYIIGDGKLNVHNPYIPVNFA